MTTSAAMTYPSTSAPAPAQPHQRRAFTLVEIMIVVVILGILAAMVIPQFTSATEASRENSVKMDLYRIRSQLELYKEFHGGYPSLVSFEGQMTKRTSATGAVAPDGTPTDDLNYRFGPYVLSLPRNPLSDSSLPLIGDGATGTSQWLYNETTGKFQANDSDESLAY